MMNATEAVFAGRPVWPAAVIVADSTVFLACGLYGLYSARPTPGLTTELKESETIMEDTTADSKTVDPTKKELPHATREELQRPPVAYPTIALLVATYALYIGSFYGFVQGHFHWSLALILSTTAVYWSFTVLHDSVHIAVAPKYRWLNELCGFLAGLPLFAPLPFFRYIHLNHHRYAGDEELDPDAYAGRGPTILLPFRWASNLYFYIYYFGRTLRLRANSGISEATKKKDIQLGIVSLTVVPTIPLVLGSMYYFVPYDRAIAPIVCVLIPQHIAAMFLIYLFDYVPHRPHKIHYKEDPFKSTNATSFLGSVDGFLWTSVTLSQNLHIIHHIWPFMPFYTYKSLWKIHGKECMEKGTRVVPLFVTDRMSNVFTELQTTTKKVQ